MTKIKALLVTVALVVLPASAWAHPGRVDATGCHNVHKDFHYADGRFAPAGSRHCHPAEQAGTSALWFSKPSADVELPDTARQNRREVEAP